MKGPTSEGLSRGHEPRPHTLHCTPWRIHVPVGLVPTSHEHPLGAPPPPRELRGGKFCRERRSQSRIRF